MMRFSVEVETARRDGAPIVALESTIISHGLPRPMNREVAVEVEEIVRSNGAVPATIAIIDGVTCVGLAETDLERISNDREIVKASIRDLPVVAARGISAATTVAATSHIASAAGISVFATGGLGGVHRGARETWDESADLSALASIPILVVCAGAKSILDVPATLERLETLSVPIIGYRTNRFPGFYLADSGYPLEYRCDEAEEIAAIWKSRSDVGTINSGLVVAQPVTNEMDRTVHDSLLKEGLAAAESARISSKGVTPFLLEYFHTHSNGESMRVNVDIIKSNAALAATIAVEISK